MLYFKLLISDDIEIIGNYPQTEFSKGYNPNNPNGHWNVKHNSFPNFQPNYELDFTKNAIPTDLIDAASCSHGLVISKKFKEILEEFNLPPSKFYPLNVKYKNENLPYYWFHFIIDDIWSSLDLEKSTIKITHNSNHSNFVIQPAISKEFLIKLDNYYASIIDYNFSYDKLCFNENFQNFDILNIDKLHYDALISSKLKKRIEAANLTGFETQLFRGIQNR
jgi:hypothetical protein